MNINEKSKEELYKINEKLRQKLMYYRVRNEMTLAEFIRKSEISESNVLEWLRGEHPLTKWDTVWKACRVLKVKMG